MQSYYSAHEHAYTHIYHPVYIKNAHIVLFGAIGAIWFGLSSMRPFRPQELDMEGSPKPAVFILHNLLCARVHALPADAL